MITHLFGGYYRGYCRGDAMGPFLTRAGAERYGEFGFSRHDPYVPYLTGHITFTPGVLLRRRPRPPAMNRRWDNS